MSGRSTTKAWSEQDRKRVGAGCGSATGGWWSPFCQVARRRGVPAAVGRLFRLEIDGTIRAMAAAFTEPTLRSLDAIHLATAQLLTNESGAALLAFVTYDRGLLDSAKALGLPTASPGQN